MATAQRSRADRSVELSEEVLEEIKDGQEAAIDAVRGFVRNVDKTLAGSASPSQVEEIVDSALKMADKLVETEYGFLKKVVRSAGESLGKSTPRRKAKAPAKRKAPAKAKARAKAKAPATRKSPR